MTWELDHLFFASAEAADVERELTDYGILFSVRRVHAGQGTANACAVFDNTYLEILRCDDEREIRSDLVRPLGLDERIRWRETGACPIGLCLRPGGADLDPTTWPFETWSYEPSWVAKGNGIPMVTPARQLAEPLIFISNWPKAAVDGSVHRGSRRTLTGVEVRRPPGPPLSAGVDWFRNRGLFTLETKPGPALELEWDHNREGRSHQFSSAPLGLRW